MPSKEQFVDVCLSYQGTPFHHQGRTPHVGLDCVGLPICAAREIGIPVIDDITYPHEPSAAHLANMLSEVNDLKRVPLDDDMLGDLILMRYSRQPTHIAIRTHLGIVHAYAPMRKVVEMPLSESLVALFVGRYRFSWPS